MLTSRSKREAEETITIVLERSPGPSPVVVVGVSIVAFIEEVSSSGDGSKGSIIKVGFPSSGSIPLCSKES